MKVQTVIDRLCSWFGAHSEKERAAMTYRLKQLQRMGWPTQLGTGPRDNWSEEAYVDLLIVSELRSLGIAAQTALDLAKANIGELRKAYAERRTAEIPSSSFGLQPTASRLVIDFSKSRVADALSN